MLTDTAIRKTKPTDTPQKLRDGRGLYLLIRPDGGRWWRWDYRRPVTGKRNTLSLGTYPDTGLADARERHQPAHRDVRRFSPRQEIVSKKFPGGIFNDACVGSEGVASKDGSHKNPADQANPKCEARRARRQGVLSFGDAVNLWLL